jgi:hypothetical protein
LPLYLMLYFKYFQNIPQTLFYHTLVKISSPTSEPKRQNVEQRYSGLGTERSWVRILLCTKNIFET